VDGVKLFTVRESDNLNTSVNLGSGKHRFAFVAVNSTGNERYVKTVYATVGACGIPATVGINICLPGSTAVSPVKIAAYARVSGTIYRFELWVNGVKKVSVENSGTMQTTISLPKGNLRFDFIARNTAGERIVKTKFVQVGGTTCTISGRMRICSPVDGSTVSSPIHVSADWAASSDPRLPFMEIFIDGRERSGFHAFSISTDLEVRSGVHVLSVCGSFDANTVECAEVTITVR
jgi:hypothetical protein